MFNGSQNTAIGSEAGRTWPPAAATFSWATRRAPTTPTPMSPPAPRATTSISAIQESRLIPASSALEAVPIRQSTSQESPAPRPPASPVPQPPCRSWWMPTATWGMRRPARSWAAIQSSDTFVGSGALAGNTGSYNVALGVSSLGANTGSYNVALGDNSLVNNQAPTTLPRVTAPSAAETSAPRTRPTE